MHFHGRPCKYGHTLRRISDRHCVECNAERNRKWQRANPDKINARNRAHRERNADRVRQQQRESYLRAKKNDPRRAMLQGAKARAKVRGQPCTITLDDIVIPERCPLLGLMLHVSGGKPKPDSPSLDRVFNAYGYVRGNVIVISHQANVRKGNLSSSELRVMAKNLARLERDAMHTIVRSGHEEHD
jgi:hypothetical protein